nr:MAG TPA: hypothetical protein [Caudoviricetes sp.]DAT27363.1 MAG TPA: hypothetical protein [Caudoviricetes sp.]
MNRALSHTNLVLVFLIQVIGGVMRFREHSIYKTFS